MEDSKPVSRIHKDGVNISRGKIENHRVIRRILMHLKVLCFRNYSSYDHHFVDGLLSPSMMYEMHWYLIVYNIHLVVPMGVYGEGFNHNQPN